MTNRRVKFGWMAAILLLAGGGFFLTRTPTQPKGPLFEGRQIGHSQNDSISLAWLGNGVGTLGLTGTTPVATFKIKSFANKDIVCRILAEAKLGGAHVQLPVSPVTVPAGGEVDVPLDLRPALAIHPLQKKYETLLSVFVQPSDGTSRPLMGATLNDRLLVLNDAGAKVYDSDAFAIAYPKAKEVDGAEGISDAEAQAPLTEQEYKEYQQEQALLN